MSNKINQELKKEIFTIPNILSFFRIVLIPFIVFFAISDLVYWTASMIVLSGITDIADGFIARKFNMVSALGKALDPIADKLTLLALIICVCFDSRAMAMLLGIFVIKEFLMGLEGLIIVKKTGTTYSARWYGKITTLFMYAAMFTHIIWVDITTLVSNILMISCSALVIVSFILYTIDNYKYLKNFDETLNVSDDEAIKRAIDHADNKGNK